MIKAFFSSLLGNWQLALILLLAFGAYTGGLVWRAHHAGWGGGVASMQAKLDTANTKIGALTEQRDQALAKVGQVKQQLAENAAARSAAQQQGQQALAQAQAQAADADRTLKAWMDKYAAALRSPDCQTPKELICPALRDY